MFCNSSIVVGENLSPDDPLFWSRPTPINCNTVRIIGIFLCLAAFIGIVFNGALSYSFVRYKFLRTPSNIFIMFISGIGLLASCCIIPLAGSSSLYCYWLYGRIGCQLEAIMAFLYGCSSSYLLCAVSLSRCYIIVKPFNAKSVSVAKCIIIACVAVIIAFIWTMLPLIGWNEYTLEGALTSCCVNWYDRRPLYVSFNFFLFIVVYCIPLIILVVTNTIIYLGLKRMKYKISKGVKTELSHKRIEMEGRILKSIIITVCGFIITWTPYAIVFFISAFRNTDEKISPLATFVCACFAKSSVMWIPMLYISTSTHFRLIFVDMNSMDKQGTIGSTDEGEHNPSVVAGKNDKTKTLAIINIPLENKFSAIDEQ
ncbi:unnamed protein product [Rotaria sp. Silwood2]|nr:unnamed protein product [Rotaria sp. Silwood2]CAF2681426.1 unnamed protein product [Rotaria sp. Silwood2]CAF2953254.1 unnamed protein product [Rotaria sp. Silwood2]CAF3096905.1 unnamed protein product [Rotaria sp. Silwood2]CAF3862873.1 unnamed protein product [Rotaria sp. Silwood2]